MPDYEIGADRAGNFRPLVGHGVLAIDGREWTKSRAMLRFVTLDLRNIFSVLTVR
jgi:hypothetical protein